MRTPSRTALLHALARLVLFWERLWPALLPVLCVLGLFMALALLEVPTLLPVWFHATLLVLFGLLLLGAVWLGGRQWYVRGRGPGLLGAAVSRRLERDSGLAHRPLGTLQDQLVNSHDSRAAALWRAHQRRATGQSQNLRVGLPRPGLPQADPWALRALVFLLLAMGLFVGGVEAPQRLRQALSLDFSVIGAVEPELEAWINPPDYTGLPPVKLDPNSTEALPIAQGSILMARVYGGSVVPRLSVDGAVTPFLKIDSLNYELNQTIEAGQRLSVASAERALADWPLNVIIDQPPTVKADEAPKATVRQALRLSYQAADDYGLAQVWAELRLAAPKGPAAADGAKNPKVTGPVLRLELPLSPPGARQAREAGFFDLTPHVWAGLEVELHFLAKDENGQVGRSEAIAVRLPERQFQHPVAQAIIEQRQILTRQPERLVRVALALFAIAKGPEAYAHDQVVYLALWTAARRLQFSHGESATAILEMLWQVALRIEDGGMSLAERDLRAAQDALMAALAEGADQAEIERLMDQLQKAMDKYLQALAEQTQRNNQAQGPQPIDPNARAIDAAELQKMLDRIRELSRLGAKDAAREMLRDLQEMLENLDGRRMTAQPQGGSPGEKAMRQLGELLQNQQELMDRTYQQTPRRRRMPWEKGNSKGDGKGDGDGDGDGDGNGAGGEVDGGKRRAMGNLAGRQGTLRQQLGDVMRQLGEGMGKIPDAMGGVDQAMRNSQRALRSGRGGKALSSQRSAIDGLAEGFRELAEQMMGNPEQDNAGQHGQRQEDPAGRPFQGGGMDTSRVMIPNQGEMQRARRILDELRRRAGERARARLERDYIERLLDRF
jgi:uncharacterized protein (TIGR02302 family)